MTAPTPEQVAADAARIRARCRAEQGLPDEMPADSAAADQLVDLLDLDASADQPTRQAS